MKNSLKICYPCWVQNDLSDEAAYEIHIFLSNLAWEFLNHYHEQIDQHEQAISFMEENSSSTLKFAPEEENLPF